MLEKNKHFLFLFALTLLSGCQQQGRPVGVAVSGSGASSTGSTTGVSVTSTSNPNEASGFQIITKADPSTGSFDPVSIPAGGGISVKAQRIYYLDGTIIGTGYYPTWFMESRVFLTSTRTSGANPATPNGSNTPCAYFDAYVDNNPDNNGFYTIDGYNTTATGSDIDQCAGTAAGELNQLGMYVRVDRRFMNSTDRLQLIVKAKVIDDPNTAPTAVSCVVGGFFDASACSNAVYTVTMRTSPGASSKPFFILFPSAKALDLLSESILLPIHINTNISTISIDRAKGGAVIYGISVIRLQ